MSAFAAEEQVTKYRDIVIPRYTIVANRAVGRWFDNTHASGQPKDQYVSKTAENRTYNKCENLQRDFYGFS